MGVIDQVGRLYKSHGLPELHGIKVLVRSLQHVLGTRMFPLCYFQSYMASRYLLNHLNISSKTIPSYHLVLVY